MQHPTDLKTFLEAELTLCHNTTIRKHIKKTLEELEHFPETHPAPEA